MQAPEVAYAVSQQTLSNNLLRAMVSTLKDENEGLKKEVQSLKLQLSAKDEEMLKRAVAISSMREELQTATEALEKAKKDLIVQTEFELPLTLEAASLEIKRKNAGITDELVNFAKRAVIKLFEKKKSLHDVACFVGSAIGEREGGAWFCCIRPASTVSTYTVWTKGNKYFILQFRLEGSAYYVDIRNTCHSGCRPSHGDHADAKKGNELIRKR